MFSKKYVNSFSVFFSLFFVATTLSTVIAKGSRNSRKKKKRGRNEMRDVETRIGYVTLSVGAVGFFALGCLSSYIYNRDGSTGGNHVTEEDQDLQTQMVPAPVLAFNKDVPMPPNYPGNFGLQKCVGELVAL